MDLLVVLFSRSLVPDSLRPHGPQHARPPCPSPTPGVHPNPRPLSRWCHPAISSSVVPFSSCPQSFPASGLFQGVGSPISIAAGRSTGVFSVRACLYVFPVPGRPPVAVRPAGGAGSPLSAAARALLPGVLCCSVVLGEPVSPPANPEPWKSPCRAAARLNTG